MSSTRTNDFSDCLNTYLKRHPNTRYLDAIVCDLSCVMRGKRYPIDVADKLFDEGMMLPGSTFLLAATGESLDPMGIGFSDGDPDYRAVPINGTLVPAPWNEPLTAQVMLTMEDSDNQPYYYEPRNVLARVIDRFEELKLRPVVAFELEFYLIDPANDGGQHLRPPHALHSGQGNNAAQVYRIDDVEDFSDYLHEVSETCAQQGIKTGPISSEYAPCQFEINLYHSDQPLKTADQCTMFRRVVQRLAKKHNLQASFMAKPYPEQSGSGLHLHVSVLDENGNNAFTSNSILEHAIGGLQQSMAESMAIFAPNSNSYRRFITNSYVPVSPSWGYENRSVAIRVPNSPASARRLEYRVAGADANPYLVLATVLAGIHHGICKKIAAGAPTEGNAGATLAPSLPIALETAMDKLRNSRTLPDYFGIDYINAYHDCKLSEYREFTNSRQCEASWYL